MPENDSSVSAKSTKEFEYFMRAQLRVEKIGGT